MAEENIEETNVNQEEEEILEEDKPQQEKETPTEKTESPKEEFSDKEKRLYARVKQAEKEAKEAKAKLAETKKPVSDIDAILEVQQATKGLDPIEVSELKIRATAKGCSLSEARKDENFSLWQTAHREKVAKEKSTPEPSNRQGGGEKEEKPLSKMTIDEKAKYFADRGFVAEFPKAKPL
ncbi:MAG: hypothetical protein ACTSPI_18195 [Candidatus Heimdallarchaeaceae archaeon]